MKIIAVRRDDRFSPNCVEKDRLILEAACNNLCQRCEFQGEACALRWVDEAELTPEDDADLYLTMARLPEALDVLEGFVRQGRRVLNKPQGVKNCQRSLLEKVMRQNSSPMPEETDLKNPSFPLWLKRADAAAQTKDDVVFCPNEDVLQRAMADFQQRGITDFVLSRHVEGDVVKFYGVGDVFFRHFYPTDDGQTKFADEANHNGEPHHYPFDVAQLQSEAARLAQLLQMEVYGGDAIISREGHFYIIDFNDWPSFSRCRDEAAEAIANLLLSTS